MSKHTSKVILPILLAVLPLGCRKPESTRKQAPLQAVAGEPERAPILLNGSSTVHPISEGVLSLYASRLVADVSLETSGTGGGFKLFCRGETDINGASRPISPAESKLCETSGVRYLELPVAFDGVVVVVPVSNDFAAELTTAELRKIWATGSEGVVKSWKDVRPTFPDLPLALFGPGIESGTFDFFTDAVVGQEGESRSDYVASEDDHFLAREVSETRGAMGYFGLSYYLSNRGRLKALAIDDERPENGSGPIAPDPEAIINGRYQPLSRPLFLYVSEKSIQRDEVLDFVTFYLKSARLVAPDVGAVGLSSGLLQLSLGRLEQRKYGSVFSSLGDVVGLSFADLLDAEMNTVAPK